MTLTAQVELRVGQAVSWPKAPAGIAQIEELRRARVRLIYRCKNGRHRHPVVSIGELLAQQPLLFTLHNPLNRGLIERAKRYALGEAQ